MFDINNDLDGDKELEYDKQMQKIKEEIVKSFGRYRETLTFMAADAPISILNLPKPIETILINNGCLRIYDMFNMDFTKIKGLGATRIRQLTTCIDEFFSML
jgi:hypothetical protein